MAVLSSLLAVTTSGLVAGAIVVLLTIGLAAVQARRRTLSRGRGRDERRPDDS